MTARGRNYRNRVRMTTEGSETMRATTVRFAPAGPTNRLLRMSLLALVSTVIVGALLVCPRAALATYVHPAEGSFNGEKTLNAGGGEVPGGNVAGTGTKFALVPSVAVSEASGTVYVAGLTSLTSNATVYEFEPDGVYDHVAITGSETPAGSFGLFSATEGFATSGIAIDNSGDASKGDLYVADMKANVIDKFSAAGAYLCQITALGVKSAKQCAEGGKEGEGEAPAFKPRGIAVGPTGDVYMTDATTKAVDVFSSAGKFLESITTPDITAPTSIAVSAAGTIYVVNGGTLEAEGTNVVEDDAGTFTIIDTAKPHGIAVDPADGHLYVQEEPAATGVVDEYEGSTLISTFASGDGSLGGGWLGVDGESGRVYFAAVKGLGAASVYIFGGGVVVPDLLGITAAETVGETTATLAGEVQADEAHGAEGEVVRCEFEYVTEAEFKAHATHPYEGAKLAPCAPSTFSGKEGVTADLTGLEPGTSYHARLEAEDAGGEGVPTYSSGAHAEVGFHTLGEPAVSEESAGGRTQTGVTLHADVNPNGHQTTYQFEYGLCATPTGCATSGYEGRAPEAAASIGDGTSAVPVEQTITELALGGTYHYRVIATNDNGQTVHGPEMTFATVPVTEVTGKYVIARATTATVHATLTFRSQAEECDVEYVSEADFRASGYADAGKVGCEAPTEEEGTRQIAIALGGLAEQTVYDYRLAITSETYGAQYAPTEEFATFGIESFAFGLFDQEGGPYTQAGGHPFDLQVALGLNHTTPNGTTLSPNGTPKDIAVTLPQGLIGNPSAVPQCSRWASERFECPAASQVGVLALRLATEEPTAAQYEEPIYNITPPEGVAAEFGARFNNFASAYITAKVQPNDEPGGYGISADSLNITTFGNPIGVSVTMWGTPGSSGHDSERFCRNQSVGGTYEVPPCEEGSAGLPETPFLTNPTLCGGPLSATASVNSYQNPEPPIEETATAGAMTGCEKLHFTPTLKVTPTTTSAASPTGLDVDLHIPQEESAAGLAEANLKDATVTLPAGVTINPAQASGLVGCSESQIGLKEPQASECPGASEIGTVELETPLYPHRVFDGGIYVAQQGNAGSGQGANPFGSLVALYIVIDEPETGVIIKLAGEVGLDPTTGRLTTTFKENPLLPFEEMRLHFEGGQRSALATPATCGTYTTNGTLTPWSGGAAVQSASSFQVSAGPGGGACAKSEAEEPNDPSFSAGTVNPLAGSYSPFVMKLGREDGSQQFKALNLTLPPGLTGRLAGVPYCPQSGIDTAESRDRPGDGALEQSSPSCPEASQVGTVTVAAGVGEQPLYVGGKAYLAGPYKGAPLSLLIVTPAVAGPFDLGVVAVRAAMYVNEETAQITVKSDPIPTILEGIPLNVRSIAVSVDRPEFTLNPTSCEAMAVGGEAVSTTGNVAMLQNRFQAADCANLAFKPGLKLRLKGSAKRIGHPALRAVVTAKPGEANIARAQVNLPHSEFLDQGNLNKTCTKPVLLDGNCPKSTIYGKAKAWTPLLEKPLEGNVYLVGGYGYKLPALVAELNGQIKILLVGKVDSGKNKGIRSTFEVVPDAPVSRFELSMKGGGKYGLLENSEPLCAKTRRANARFVGQNGTVDVLHPKVAAQCKKTKKKAHARHRGSGKGNRKKS
jgi:hypothetical protein